MRIRIIPPRFADATHKKMNTYHFGALWYVFIICLYLTEIGCPFIKMVNTQVLEHTCLKITHKGVQLCHWVTNRCACNHRVSMWKTPILRCIHKKQISKFKWKSAFCLPNLQTIIKIFKPRLKEEFNTPSFLKLYFGRAIHTKNVEHLSKNVKKPWYNKLNNARSQSYNYPWEWTLFMYSNF